MTDTLTKGHTKAVSRSVLLDINRLFSKGDHKAALALAHNTASLYPLDTQLLQIIGRIYLGIGEPEQAASYLKRALNQKESPKEFYSHSEFNSDDITYLDSQSDSLQENEFTIGSDQAAQTEYKPLNKRPIITLKGRKAAEPSKSTAAEVNESKNSAEQIVEPTDLPVAEQNHTQTPQKHKRPILTLKTEINADKQPVSDELDAETDVAENSSVVDLRVDPFEAEFDHATEPEPEPEPEPELQIEEADECLGLLDEETPSDLEEELSLNNDIFDSVEDEFNPDAQDGIGSLEFGGEFEETDLYEFWEDHELLEDDEPALEISNTLSRYQRARQEAADLIDQVGWSKSQLDLITTIFIENGWSAAKRTLLEEIHRGASFETIEVARELKLLWKESERYWIYFARGKKDQTLASYKHFSWRQSIRLINIYASVPSIEELHEMLEVEFEYWYSNPVLRRKYPAFVKYLLYCRFSESKSLLPSTNQLFFFNGHDDCLLDDSCMFYEGSDEYKTLSECGIELNSAFTTKNYYASDIPFDHEEGILLYPKVLKKRQAIVLQEEDLDDEYDETE